MRPSLLVIAALTLTLGACGDDPTGLSNGDFAPELGIDLNAMTKTASGLYVQDLVVGAGDQSVVGALLTVDYEGWLQDATKFDSSFDYGEPLTIRIGVGFLIAGWDEGLIGMRVGGLRRLVIPPHLGYGAEGWPPVIPRNATLVFRIELLEVE